MNASRTGSSETVYFEVTDLHLHIRTTIRNESPAIKLICVRFSALKGFIVSGRVPDLMERPKMKSDVVPGQNWKGGDFPAVSALASTQTFAKGTGKSEKCHIRTWSATERASRRWAQWVPKTISHRLHHFALGTGRRKLSPTYLGGVPWPASASSVGSLPS